MPLSENEHEPEEPRDYYTAIQDHKWRTRVEGLLEQIQEALPLHAAAVQNKDSLAIISAINQQINQHIELINGQLMANLRTELRHFKETTGHILAGLVDAVDRMKKEGMK